MTNEATGGSDAAAVLDPVELRVLAVLAEKEALTPDNYPMSLNAIVNGCNQLSSRDPVMQLSDDIVLDTLQRLTERKLVNAISQAGARVVKYEHRMRIKWTLEQDKLHEFKSVQDVETALQFLIDKYPPLVVKLERAPGTKESRYGQLLGGEITIVAGSEQTSSASSGQTQGGRIAQLEEEVASLRGEMDELKAQFEAFRQQFQ